MKPRSFIKDKYRAARGGYSQVLEIVCGNCKKSVCFYQKDGPGPLKRMYRDRIITGASQKKTKINSNRFLCPHCNEWLGMAYVYAKEKRNALKLFVGAITKRRSSLKKVL